MSCDALSRRRNSYGPQEGPADKGFKEREQERQAFEQGKASAKQPGEVAVSWDLRLSRMDLANPRCLSSLCATRKSGHGILNDVALEFKRRDRPW